MNTNHHHALHGCCYIARQVVALWEAASLRSTAHNNPSVPLIKSSRLTTKLFFVAVADNEVVGTIMAGYDGHRGWNLLRCWSPITSPQGIGSRLVSHAERGLDRPRVRERSIFRSWPGQRAGDGIFSSMAFFSVERRLSMGQNGFCGLT